ncbi:MAG: flagellar hook assembly protein FlgD [Gallionellaceae bacterium]|jgi:flagellar basal-body rod modification protein FlgD|nr:flagellar hook assembly protein FlgD [Gallionellaceae bacterium]
MIDTTQNANSAAALFASMNANSGSAAKTSKAAETQDRFLKLLVTQMKNQDPLNPMDNAQVTSQMAQLSTVTGIDKLNVTLQALSDSMVGNQSLQAASMIGRGVLVDGKGVDLSGGKGYGGFELEQSVKNARVSIYDKAGALVRNIDLGAQPAGIAKWAWDGKSNTGAVMADGSYTFDVSANYGKDTAASTLQFGVVSSVTQGKQGVALSIGQLDGIALSQVRQIL